MQAQRRCEQSRERSDLGRVKNNSEVRVLATQSLNHNDRLDAQAVDMQNLRGEFQARITGLERRVERVERYREDTRRWRKSLDASVQTAFRALRVAPVADTQTHRPTARPCFNYDHPRSDYNGGMTRGPRSDGLNFRTPHTWAPV